MNNLIETVRERLNGDRNHWNEGEIKPLIDYLFRRLNEIEKLVYPDNKDLDSREREGLFADGDHLASRFTPINFYPVNCIPGGRPGRCHTALEVFCIGNDGLSGRLEECKDVSGIFCHGNTKLVLFVSDKWDRAVWMKFEPVFEFLRGKFGLIFIRVLLDSRKKTAGILV